jgi:hypothetical protein
MDPLGDVVNINLISVHLEAVLVSFFEGKGSINVGAR